MADKNLMTPSTSSLSGLMGNGLRFEIPKFQRDYSWEAEQWDDLWLDLISLFEDEESEHYMGYLVLQTSDNKNFSIIDGQQRLTTMSLLILSVLKCLDDLINNNVDSDNNNRRKEALRNSYIGNINPVTLISDNKIKLNRNSDPFYQRNLLQLISPQNELMLIDSDRLLWQAFDFFYKKIGELYSNATGSELATFLSKSIGDKLSFTVIEVTDQLNAFKVFETLNARGVQLSSSDLLKNYLFSIVDETKPHKSEIEELESLWSKVLGKLGSQKFEEYLRYYWNSKNKIVRKNNLFKTIKKSILNKKQAFTLIRDLNTNADIFTAIQNPNDELWLSNKQLSNYLNELKLYQVRQVYSLFLIAYQKLNIDDFTKLVKYCSIISFRYNVIGSRQANRMEELYNSVSQKIFNLSLTTAQGIFNEIRELYISDADFKNDFSTLKLYSYGRTKKLARYILFELENNLMQGGDRDYELDPATIEHILPENAGANWDNDFPQIIQPNYIYRLGNYTLLEDHINRDCEILPFDQKKAFYSNSQYQMSNEINYNDWNPTILDRRQNDLARKATSIWRISYT
ncbi:DUF262 domain-containing protein [Flavobacterium columnare]|uniref:DUF262 domain-containing protein n=1 Tax=Flavobacterium columnare TaxID=996 RepID=UPI001BC89867|nr:DUF262 domain-containing protein [Flavobacterium columnare]AUX17391.1 hypothetical protein AQ623_03090 [Flavobacterium columnare]